MVNYTSKILGGFDSDGDAIMVDVSTYTYEGDNMNKNNVSVLLDRIIESRFKACNIKQDNSWLTVHNSFIIDEIKKIDERLQSFQAHTPEFKGAFYYHFYGMDEHTLANIIAHEIFNKLFISEELSEFLTVEENEKNYIITKIEKDIVDAIDFRFIKIDNSTIKHKSEGYGKNVERLSQRLVNNINHIVKESHYKQHHTYIVYVDYIINEILATLKVGGIDKINANSIYQFFGVDYKKLIEILSIDIHKHSVLKYIMVAGNIMVPAREILFSGRDFCIIEKINHPKDFFTILRKFLIGELELDY